MAEVVAPKRLDCEDLNISGGVRYTCLRHNGRCKLIRVNSSLVNFAWFALMGLNLMCCRCSDTVGIV